jgi:hypothetical protein
VDEDHAGLGRSVFGGGDRHLDAVTALQHHGAVGPGRLGLGDGRALGHVDLARHAQLPGREGKGLRMVARAPGRHAPPRRRAELGELRHRTADLERSGALEVLGLQDDLATDSLADRGAGDHRRALDRLGTGDPSPLDAVIGDLHRFRIGHRR